MYEISEFNVTINFLLPNKVKVFNTLDDIRLRSKLTNNKTIKIAKNIFLNIY